MRITVAQVKVYPAKGKMEHNHALLEQVLADIAPHRPDVVITPEGWLDGYASTEDSVEDMTDYAIDPADSPQARAIAQYAGANNCWVVYGCTRVADGSASGGAPACHNSALIYNRRGELAGTYDKVHLQSHDAKYSPGNSLPVFDADFGCFGVMICADRRWPETVRTLAMRGARVIFNPTYGMSCDLNLAIMRTRSFENEVFIIFTHPGQSLITGPGGRVITNDEDDGHRFAVTEIDLAEVGKARERALSHLKDRRPDVYEL